MNESDISNEEIHVSAGIKGKRITRSLSESSDGDFDYDTELRNTENEDGEEVDQVLATALFLKNGNLKIQKGSYFPLLHILEKLSILL